MLQSLLPVCDCMASTAWSDIRLWQLAFSKLQHVAVFYARLEMLISSHMRNSGQVVQVTASQASELTANQAKKSVGSDIAADKQAAIVGHANALSRAQGDSITGTSSATGSRHAQRDIHVKK